MQFHRELQDFMERMEYAIYSGFGGGNLPACAGGKEYPDLSLQLAEAKPQQVDLIFNLELDGLVSVYGTELDVESREKKITVK